MRLSRFLFFVLLASRLLAMSPLLVVENHLLPSPGIAGAAAPQLTRSADGTVYLCWIEPNASGVNTVRVAHLDSKSRSWSMPKTVAEGAEIALNALNTPQIAASSTGGAVLAWYVKRPDKNGTTLSYSLISRSPDRGETWEKSQPLTPESTTNERAAISPLPDGRFLAVWLDGREISGGHGNQTLRSRILFSDAADVLIDPRVCDCCATSVAAFDDGSAIAFYRDRSDEEIRDIATARWKDGRWTAPTLLGQEGWKINGCPMNGPSVSTNGGRVVAAWFTLANDQPAVYAATSATGGQPFLMPARIDDGKPLGQVSTVQLQDGTAFVSWVESESPSSPTAIWLRRIAPDGALSVPVRLATTSAARLSGTPRLAMLKDFDATAAELVLAHTLVDGGVAHLSTRLITVMAAEPDRNPCALCPPEETRGSPVHGYIQSIDTKAGTAKVRHDDIPGVMPAMTMRFRVAPEELTKLQTNAEIFGRIERRGDGWWLFAVRPAASAVPGR